MEVDLPTEDYSPEAEERLMKRGEAAVKLWAEKRTKDGATEEEMFAELNIILDFAACSAGTGIKRGST
jgi:hypothetical protein